MLFSIYPLSFSYLYVTYDLVSFVFVEWRLFEKKKICSSMCRVNVFLLHLIFRYSTSIIFVEIRTSLQK